MSLQVSFKGLTYVFFFVFTSFLILLFNFLPSYRSSPYTYNSYDYVFFEDYNTIDNLNNLDDLNWKSSKLDRLLYNPKNYQYSLIRIELPTQIKSNHNLHIKTSKNNFEIFMDEGRYVKSKSQIQKNGDFISTPNTNIYTLYRFQKSDYIYLQMQTNIPAYNGYLTELNIIEKDSRSAIYLATIGNFLMFSICFVYAFSFTLYLLITNATVAGLNLKRLSFTILLFTLFLLLDSTDQFVYLDLTKWTMFVVISLSFITAYYINSIASFLSNTPLKDTIKKISYSFVVPIVAIIYLDLNKMYSYSFTFKYTLIFIILSLTLITTLLVLNKVKSINEKIVFILNLMFIAIFIFRLVEDIQLINIHFSNLLVLLFLIFGLFSFIIIKYYLKKNEEMIRLTDLVLEKRFEVSTVIDCVDNTISTDYDIISFCKNIESSISKLISKKEYVSLYMYSLTKSNNEFKTIYSSGDTTYFRAEIEELIEKSSNFDNGIYHISNKEELHFCIKNNDFSVLTILRCRPYFDENDLEKLRLYFLSIKKTLENILIYSSSMSNQENILMEVSKIINGREQNKYNSSATGELIYYIARKSGMTYTNAMKCKIASYAINIGKLNIRTDLLNKRVLSKKELNEYNEYINITNYMVKRYNNSIMKLVTTISKQYNDNYLNNKNIDINVRIIKVANTMSYYYLNKLVYSYGKFNSALQLVEVQSGIELDPDIIKILIDNKKEITELLNKYL